MEKDQARKERVSALERNKLEVMDRLRQQRASEKQLLE